VLRHRQLRRPQPLSAISHQPSRPCCGNSRAPRARRTNCTTVRCSSSRSRPHA